MGTVSKININTILSENYMEAAAFDGYRDISLVSAAGSGQDYLAGIDGSGKLVIACPKNGDDTGHVLLETGKKASTFDVESGGDGDILVGYASGNKLAVLSVMGEATDKEASIDLSLSGSETLAKVLIYRRDYVLYLFALYQQDSGYGLKTVEFMLTEWTYRVTDTSFSVNSLSVDCLRDNLGILLIAIEDGKFKSYNAFTGEKQEAALSMPGKLLCFSAVNSSVDGEGVLAAFDVDGTAGVYLLNEGTTEWTDIKLTMTATPKDMTVAYYSEFFHIFISAEASDGTKKLYHAQQPEAGGWEDSIALMPISGKLKDFYVNQAEDSHLGVIFTEAEGSSDGEKNPYGFLKASELELEHLSMSENGEWNISHTVVDTSQSQIYNYNCFYTQLVFYEENGAAYAGLEVQVTADTAVEATINGLVYGITPGEWITVKTDIMGRLRISQMTEELSAPELRICPQDDAKKQYTVVPHDYLRKKFQSITADDLKQAKLDDGSQLIPESQQGSCQETAELIREVFAEENYNCGAYEKDAVIAHNPAGIYCTPLNGGMVFGELLPSAKLAFRVSFRPDGSVSFQNYTGTDWQLSVDGLGSIWGAISDFARSIVKKTVDLVELAVQTVENAVVAVVDIVVDGVKKAVNFVVKTVKDIFNAVTAIFQKIKVGFEKVIHWLGQLFAWDDIKNTKDDLVDYVNESWDTFTNIFDRCGTFVNYLDTLVRNSQNISSMFSEELPEGLDLDKESSRIPQDSVYFNGQVNNIVMNRMLNLAADGGDACLVLTALPDADTLMDDIMACLKSFGTTVSDKAAGQIEVFKNAASTHQVGTILSSLNTLFTLLLEAAKSAVGTFLELLKNLISRLLAQIKEILNQDIQIPFVTPLLKKVCGVTKISLLDILMFIPAIPCTIIGKLALGHAPRLKLEKGMLGNCYGNLKLGYVFSSICAILYYGLCVSGVFVGAKDSILKVLVFDLLPGLLLLIWTRLNMYEMDEDWGDTDVVAALLSYTSVVLFMVCAIVDCFSLDGTVTSADGYDKFVNSVTIGFGICSIVLGLIDLSDSGQSQWTKVDLISERGGIVTGLADILIAVAGRVDAGGTGSMGGSKEGAAEETERGVGDPEFVAKVIISALGGLAGLAEAILLFVELKMKPYIESISPTGTIDCSGKVTITFDRDMDTSCAGTVSFDKIVLPEGGSWSGSRQYSIDYSGLESDTQYYLYVDGFKDTKGNHQEKDRYQVRTK